MASKWFLLLERKPLSSLAPCCTEAVCVTRSTEPVTWDKVIDKWLWLWSSVLLNFSLGNLLHCAVWRLGKAPWTIVVSALLVAKVCPSPHEWAWKPGLHPLQPWHDGRLKCPADWLISLTWPWARATFAQATLGFDPQKHVYLIVAIFKSENKHRHNE